MLARCSFVCLCFALSSSSRSARFRSSCCRTSSSLRKPRVRLGKIEVQIRRLEHDQEEREPRGRRERIGGHGGDARQRGPQHRSTCEGDAEAGAHERHRRAALALVADVRRDGIRELDVALAQAADDAAGQERAEVRRRDPKRDAQDVAGHGPEQGGPPAAFVGQAADEGRGDGLEEGEERAQRAAQEDDIIAGVDGLCERVLVRVQVVEDAVEEGRRGGVPVEIEVEQGGEEGEDESEGNLRREGG